MTGLALLLALPVLAAQAPGAALSTPDMSRPPAVGAVRPYRMPPRLSWKLANGLEVVLVEDRRLPLVTARLGLRAGAAALAAEQAGLAEALAELLTDGTARRSSRDISDAADLYGGTISAEAEADSLTLSSYCLSESVEKMLSLMSEVARFPTFPESEVSLRRRNMQEELNVSRGEPNFLAGVAFYKRLFRGHPYGVTAPTDASISRLTRSAVAAAHKRLLTPRHAVLVLVGDLSAEKARSLASRHFGFWEGEPGPPAAPAVASEPSRRQVYLVDRPGSAQASILLGNLALREDHPDYFNLLVANQVLGGSFSSRLVQDIRETKGYTYSIGSRLEHRLTSSIFRVRTPVRTEVAEEALEAVLGHLARIRESTVDASELEKAKSFLAGSFARGLETREGLADAVLHMKLHRLPDDFYDSYVSRVQSVTAAGALLAAETFIRPEEMTVVVVGDARALRGALSRFSGLPPISVDQDGD